VKLQQAENGMKFLPESQALVDKVHVDLLADKLLGNQLRSNWQHVRCVGYEWKPKIAVSFEQLKVDVKISLTAPMVAQRNLANLASIWASKRA
jgi:hypothetical protein